MSTLSSAQVETIDAPRHIEGSLATLSFDGTDSLVLLPSMNATGANGDGEAPDSGYASQSSAYNTCNRDFIDGGSVVDGRSRFWPPQVRKKIKLIPYDKPIPEATKNRFLDLRDLHAGNLLKLTRGLPRCGMLMNLKVLGESEATAEPWIYVQCDKGVVRKVRSFFKQPTVRPDFEPAQPDAYTPNFRIYVCPLPPKLHGFLSTSQSSIIADSMELYGEPLIPLQLGTLCGTAVKVQKYGPYEKTWTATIGGLIKVLDREGDSTLFGITAGHFLVQEEYAEYTEGENSSDDLEVITSDDEELYELDLSSLEDETRSEYDTLAQNTESSAHPQQNIDELSKIGSIYKASHDGLQDGPNLDWALIKIHSNKLCLPNAILAHEVTKTAFCSAPKSESDVFFTTTSGKVGFGTLSGSWSYLMLAPGNVLTRTYLLTLLTHQVIHPGDSGVWVIDRETHEVYGHIVASDVFGRVYVIPIDDIFQDIKVRMSTNSVSLPLRRETTHQTSEIDEYVSISDTTAERQDKYYVPEEGKDPISSDISESQSPVVLTYSTNPQTSPGQFAAISKSSSISPRDHLLFGIDFGTTYSGIAWAWSGSPDKQYIVTDWLNDPISSPKVPSQILYEPDGIKWGFDIPEGKEPLRWFKLLLLQDEDIEPEIRNSIYIKEARETLKKLNKSAEMVVADYIGLLWRHTLMTISATLGEGIVKDVPRRVVLTIPALWPDYGKSRLLQAARNAGIGPSDLFICVEPEAAAIAAMYDLDLHGGPVKTGESYVICDVGGGAADLITYKIENAGRLEMTECAIGTGKLCSAILIDKAFDEKISDWLENRGWNHLDNFTRRDWTETNWKHWLKKYFDGVALDWGLALPATVPMLSREIKTLTVLEERKPPQKSIKNDMIMLSRGEVAGIFDPCIDQIITMVSDQIEQTRRRLGAIPKAVFLLGGLGQSPYIYARLAEEVDRLGVGIQSLSKLEVWTATCRGALLKAFHWSEHAGDGFLCPLITSRIMHKSYGIATTEPFNSLVHSSDDMFWDMALGQFRARNQIQWFAKRNGIVENQHVTNIDHRRGIKAELARNKFTVTILECDRDDPPQRKDKDVRVAGEIIFEIDTPFEALPDYSLPSGELWKSIHYQVVVTCSPVLEFAVYHNGRRQKHWRTSPLFAIAAEEKPEVVGHSTRGSTGGTWKIDEVDTKRNVAEDRGERGQTGYAEY